MKSLVLTLALSFFGGTVALAQSQNTLTGQEQKDGWKLLFDGKTTQGWHVYRNATNGAAWKVTDGELWLDPTAQGRGDFMSDNEYENFELRLDWKIEKGGNSGVIFNSMESTQYKHAWNTGPEMQILDNDGHPDGKFPKHRAGDLYDLIGSRRSSSGCARSNAGATRAMGVAFGGLSPEQRIALLSELEGDQRWRELWNRGERGLRILARPIMGALPPPIQVPHYLTMLKELTILGYFTSRTGATEARGTTRCREATTGICRIGAATGRGRNSEHDWSTSSRSRMSRNHPTARNFFRDAGRAEWFRREPVPLSVTIWIKSRLGRYCGNPPASGLA